MERSRGDLESVINSQKDQLCRYEKRLKDIIAAYKSLLKEKEALEVSLTTVLNKNGKTSEKGSSDFASQSKDAPSAEQTPCLQEQISTLMNSLATLSAEKSRMEASFQADKKALRSQLEQKDKKIDELCNVIKKKEDQYKLDIDQCKAKLIVERQEHEKESSNQMLMLRELQKLYADERHLKESIEMQLNNFKLQFATNEVENLRILELQNQLRDTKSQLDQLNGERSIADHSSSSAQKRSILLEQLQKEMQQLKEQHAVAIKTEQHRAHLAEEQSRKLAALHEYRVANLENRLAELSTSVGKYDRLRQHDQESIQFLKMQIHDLEKMSSESFNKTQLKDTPLDLLNDKSFKLLTSSNEDMSKIIENIMHLKDILLKANANSTNPIDLTHIFSICADHSHCKEEVLTVAQQLESSNRQIVELEEKVKQQKDHIFTLQEKVKDLNNTIDVQDLELKNFNENLRLTLKEERSKWQTLHIDMENDYRSKLNDLEQQLQKQRQRSIQLLDEKEQEIRTLQTSFEIFHSNAEQIGNICKNDHEHEEGIFNGTNHELSNKTTNINTKKVLIGESCHMLHYDNEIARKDIEIANLRKAKYQAETSMRKAVHEKVAAQEELNKKIGLLEEQVDRLERCMSREGANLEYLKNVIISYIVSKDLESKRHMINAISAVLQFTSQEMKTINETFGNK